MYPKRYYTKMEKAEGYFACFGCQKHSIRKSQLASSRPYMAWRGELECGVMLFSGQYPQGDSFQIPRTQQFYDSWHTIVIVAVKPLSFFSFCSVLETSWSAQIVYEIWKKHYSRTLKNQRLSFRFRKAHRTQTQSKQKQLPLVIFWYRSHVLIVRKHEN